LQAKIQKHEAFEAEINAHYQQITKLDDYGLGLIRMDHYARDKIQERLDDIHRLWEELRLKMNEKNIRLQQTLKLVQYQRDCDEFLLWIKDKELFINNSDDLIQQANNLEHVQVLQKKYEEFQKDLNQHEDQMLDLNRQADNLVDSGHPNAMQIRSKQKEVNDAWNKLRLYASNRQERLFGAHEIQRLNRDIDEAISWINEKDAIISTDDHGKDLASVQALQRKHDAIERDLAALTDKVNSLRHEADRIIQNVQDETQSPHEEAQLKNKLDDLNNVWNRLDVKCKERKQRLIDSYKLHKFLNDYRDLYAWYMEIYTVLGHNQDVEGCGIGDVSNAESLIERNYELRTEIETRDDLYKQCTDYANQLCNDEFIDGGNKAIIVDKLNKLHELKANLDKRWSQKEVFLMQLLDLQVFMRDIEQAEQWLIKQDAFLFPASSMATFKFDCLDDVEALVKKHDNFEKTFHSYDEKARLLEESGLKLIEKQNLGRGFKIIKIIIIVLFLPKQ
jgi:spectrin alpha